MNNQHLTEEQIALCAEHQMNDTYDDLSIEIRNHLQDCKECQLEVLDIIELSEQIGNPQKKNKFLTLSISISSVAAIVAIVIILILPRQINNSKHIAENIFIDTTLNKQTIKTKKDSATKIKVKTISNVHPTEHLAYYKPNKQLEALIKRTSEAGFRDGNNYKIPTTLTFKNHKTIHWPNKDNESITFEIFSNTNKLVDSEMITSSRFNLPKLKKGLYYIKIINSDFDLLYVVRVKY